MTKEQLEKARKLADEIAKTKGDIRMLNERCSIVLIDRSGMGEANRNYLSDDETRESLINHFKARAARLEKEFEEL